MSVGDFYDRLAPFYHLVYPDWEGRVVNEGDQLTEILTGLDVPPGSRIHDAACGIGTQIIGLAQRGYRVTGSDLSEAALARAAIELGRRDLDVPLRTADLRELTLDEPADALVACDNAIPHLLDDAAIRTAFERMRDGVRPGGAVVISVRDYAALLAEDPSPVRIVPFGLRRDAGRKYFAFQVWEFDGPIYDLTMYFVEDGGAQRNPERCETLVIRSRYYAISIPRLRELMAEAGLVDVQRIDDGYFQPVLTGRRPG